MKSSDNPVVRAILDLQDMLHLSVAASLYLGAMILWLAVMAWAAHMALTEISAMKADHKAAERRKRYGSKLN